MLLCCLALFDVFQVRNHNMHVHVHVHVWHGQSNTIIMTHGGRPGNEARQLLMDNSDMYVHKQTTCTCKVYVFNELLNCMISTV